MTQIMKKKIISVVLGFFVVASTLFTILALNITPVTLKRDIFEYEYGSVISNNPADYVNANESVINEVKLNFSNLKNEIGLYKVSATYAGVELPFYIKTLGKVNIRKLPSTDSQIIYTVPKEGIRYKITKLSENGEWGYVPYRDGWITLNKNYVKKGC